MQVEELIMRAISERRPVALRYEDAPHAARTVHPHVLYRTSTGKVCVDSFQVDGPSSSGGEIPGWRPFNLTRILSAELLDGEFEIAPGLNLAGPKYANGLLAYVSA